MILTREILDLIPVGTIFKVVVTSLQSEVNPLESDLAFVCCKGGGNDWGIYYGYFAANYPYQDQIQRIRSGGEKLTTDAKIKEICPCDENAMQAYRY